MCPSQRTPLRSCPRARIPHTEPVSCAPSLPPPCPPQPPHRRAPRSSAPRDHRDRTRSRPRRRRGSDGQPAPTSAGPGHVGSEGFMLASYSAPLSRRSRTPTRPPPRRATALEAAEAAITAAATVATDIEASGLVLAAPDTTVDTDDLEAAVKRLEGADQLPAPLVPAFIDDVTADVASVAGRRQRAARQPGCRHRSQGRGGSCRSSSSGTARGRSGRCRCRRRRRSRAPTPRRSSGEQPPRSAPVFAGPGTSAGEAQAIAREHARRLRLG